MKVTVETVTIAGERELKVSLDHDTDMGPLEFRMDLEQVRNLSLLAETAMKADTFKFSMVL